MLCVWAAALAAGEQVFEDSPVLTTMWQAASSGETEMFISQLIQNREFAQHRSSDGRGPMFWAYEFKNVDTLALLLHLGVSAEQVCAAPFTRHHILHPSTLIQMKLLVVSVLLKPSQQTVCYWREARTPIGRDCSDRRISTGRSLQSSSRMVPRK